MKGQKSIDGDICHELLIDKIRPQLSMNTNKDYFQWKEEIKNKFFELTGLDQISNNACSLNLQIEWTEEREIYTIIRFTFDSEIGATVPCYLLIPNTNKEKYPVAITLHGHSSGFHHSIGEVKFEGDEKKQPRSAYALQAVEHGFIALAIEQRGMGERRSKRSYGMENMYYPRPHMCAVASMTAISIGRTVIGERVWDVSKAIDALSAFSKCDLDNIIITGESGGGTASYYAACYDERIKLSVPCCAFCSYRTSILDIEHCACNYIPNVYKWFEMEDVACLIAPRELIVIAGQEDEIFPIHGVRKSFEKVQQIYKKVGAIEKCQLIETPKGHWWCEEIVWDAICRQMKIK